MIREEIAGWIEEAADLVYDYSPQGIGYYVLFNERAAQVKNMRCDTCAQELDYKISGRALIGNYTCKTPCPWRGCGGCFNHKPKVTG